MKISATLLILIFTALAQVQAQPVLSRRGPSLGVAPQIALPQGMFSEAITGTPHGLQAYVSMPVLGLPFESGLNFAWNRIARDQKDVILGTADGNTTTGDLVVKQNIFRYLGTLRLRPFNGSFRPYGEILGGLAQYASHSELSAETFDGHEQKPVVKRISSSFAWTYGWAAGIQIRLIRPLYLEVRYERLQGNAATYLNPRSLQMSNDGSYTFNSVKSDTDMQTVSLGLSLSF